MDLRAVDLFNGTKFSASHLNTAFSNRRDKITHILQVLFLDIRGTHVFIINAVHSILLRVFLKSVF